MKNSKLNYFLRTVALLCTAVSLLLCLVGCGKKKPDPTKPNPTTESTADTEPSTPPTTQPTTPPTTPPTTQPTEPQGTTEPSVPPCDHILSNWLVNPSASCTNEGERYKECTLCHAKVETEVIPKIPHSINGWVYEGKPATCTSQGKMKQECSQCKEVFFTITVDKLDHDTVPIEGYAATATASGRTDRMYCTICRNYVQKAFTIPAIGSVDYTYTTNSDGSCTLTGVNNFSGKELILPDKLDGHTVTTIGEKAFANKSIETVYIPKTVTKISAKAFDSCTKLTNITYQGTTAQWSMVQKATDWNAMTGVYTIYCSNQSIAK